MVFGASDDSNEAGVIVGGYCSTVGGQWELALNRPNSLLFGVIRRQSNRHDLWISEDHCRDSLGVPRSSLTGNYLRNHLPLGYRPVRKHRFPGYVANCIDTGHRSAAVAVDLD